MHHAQMLTAAVCLLFFPLQALAFDCVKATTPIEERICASIVLQQLDAVLMHEYPSYVQRHGAARAWQMQREWLRNERNVCDTDACLEVAYVNRIKELTQAERVFVFTEAAKDWDFVVRGSVCGKESYSNDCDGPGAVDIFVKGSEHLMQHIAMKGLYIELGETTQPTVNMNLVYGQHNSCLSLGDYNFDGHVDIALRNGNEAGYHLPSYDIFLFDRVKKRFIHNQVLTTLALESLGLFSVDTEGKQLVTFNKSGCCWHQTSFYEMTGNTPVLVRDVVEDGTVEDKFMVITEKHLVEGQWETKVTREPIELYE